MSAGKCTLHGPGPIGQGRALHSVAAAALLVSAHRTLRVGSDEAVRAPLRVLRQRLDERPAVVQQPGLPQQRSEHAHHDGLGHREGLLARCVVNCKSDKNRAINSVHTQEHRNKS